MFLIIKVAIDLSIEVRFKVRRKNKKHSLPDLEQQ